MGNKLKKVCEHCGASMMINFYTVNKTMVNALKKLHANPGVKVKNIGFTNSEYAIYSKLRHWGLIFELAGEEEGYWAVTKLGGDFLRGNARIPYKIGYFRNKLVEESPDTVSIVEVYSTPESKRKYREMMKEYRGTSQT